MKHLIAGLIMFWAGAISAHEYKVGDIRIDHPFAHPNAGPTAAGYMVVSNDGLPDSLIGVQSDVARVSIHKTILQDGVARMRPAPDIDLATGETVQFAPGGLHVMFMGLETSFAVSDNILMTFVNVFWHAVSITGILLLFLYVAGQGTER